ncbi:MAG: uncharacterized protein QG670_1142 [Thermoproteota archaeon]|nr:uncharacterized protein [Thermoproteota archaeon]
MYPCEAFARSVLPIFKGLVAKELTEKYSFTQLEAAQKLGITQASISYYINAKRGRKDRVQLEEILPAIQDVAFETAKNIAIGKMSQEELSQSFCNICELLRKNKLMKIKASKRLSQNTFIASGI